MAYMDAQHDGGTSDSKTIDLRTAVTEALEAQVNLLRRDAEMLGALLEQRVTSGSATVAEIEAYVAHRNLMAMT